MILGLRDMYVVNERIEYFHLHANNFVVRMVDFLKITFTFQVSHSTITAVSMQTVH